MAWELPRRARKHAPYAVQALVLDQRQRRASVGQIELLAALPARAPRAHLHPVRVQVAQVVGAVGVALADERHVERPRLGQRSVHRRVRGELNAQRPGADGGERRQRGALGHDAHVEARGDVAHEVELVDVVAREVDRRDARLLQLVDGLGVDDRAVEVAEEQVDRRSPVRVLKALKRRSLVVGLP